MEKVLEITNLTKLYKNKRGITDLSLDVYEGDIFGFIGPNGSGKTTAMKVMTGLMSADSGSVRIFGYDISDEYEKAMANVGCIIENAESVPYLTAYENLKQHARYYKNADDSRIEEVLNTVGMSKYKNEKTRFFSLGMKQRIGLAMALLTNPRLIILDEPLNGLDVEGMLSMRNMIKSLAESQNITFFISSHLMHDVEMTCTKVGAISNGKIICVKSMDEVREKYESLEKFFVSEVGNYESL